MKKINRNIVLGLVTFLVIFSVYLVITLSGGRKSLVIDQVLPRPTEIIAPNAASEKQIGKIGDVNIGDIVNPLYRHLDANDMVDREFTFTRILQAEGDRWQVEKPQLSFFRPDLSVIISSDTADVQTETVLKEPRPKDASLLGNVIVHIVPKEAGNMKESFAYFDSLSFESDSSRAFTDGPLRLVSEDFQLEGRKMEFVYNGQLRRLEFLRINELKSLSVKVPAKSLSLTPDANVGGKNVSAQKKLHAVEINTQPQKKDTVLSNAAQTLYRCFFNKNVKVDSNNQLIITDQFIINNILINQTSSAKSKDADAAFVAKQPTASSEPAAKEQSSELMPVSITCQDGILVTPMDSQRMPPPLNAAETIVDKRLIDQYPGIKNKAFIIGRQLTFDAISNQATLSENCTAKLLAASKAFDRRYTISAPRIQTDFSQNTAGSDLKFVKADGGVVELDIEKVEQNKTLGFTKIKCYSFNYDAVGQKLTAVGPGAIVVNNSMLTQKEAEAFKAEPNAGRFTLKKPSYALIENFAVLDYNLASDHIIATADKQSMNISYLPIIDGKEGSVVKATAGKVEAQLHRTPAGSTELVKLYATGGVTYDEQGDSTTPQSNKIQIVGSDLIYNNENPANPVISIWGNSFWPCFLNGVAVDGVEYNLSTGSIKKTKILAPVIIW